MPSGPPNTARRYLSRNEEHQYSILVAELGALDEDIKAARARAPSVANGVGLDP